MTATVQGQGVQGRVAVAPAAPYAASVLLLLLLATATRSSSSSASSASSTTVSDSSDNRTFPQGFLLGCATASYQVEGAWNESGKGENIWDRVVHSDPGSVADRANGDVACDSYHQYKKDVALLRQLGVDLYRFSLSWSRLLPDGSRRRVNPAGVEYYNNLITELLSKGIQPLVTIYHWDLPQPLQDLGGWPNPALADYYEDYADLAFSLFGDRVKLWLTFNEPFETCVTGYGIGVLAPRLNLDGIGDYLCGHTVLRAHARAYHLYHRKYAAAQRGRVGITLNSEWFEPRNASSEEDRIAAERGQQFKLGWFAHPIFSEVGDYPPTMRRRVMANSLAEGLRRSRLPTFSPAEVASIRGSADFFGLNHYSSFLVSPAAGNSSDPKQISQAKDVGNENFQDPSWPKSGASWCRVVPWGFRRLLVWIRNQFGNPPLIVTENGFPDRGELHDKGRIYYHTHYLEELLKAIHNDGCNVFGYVAWSLMDNFEWTDGYTVRFGLHYVNFSDPSRPRVAKDSAALFKRLTSSRRLPPAQETEDCLAGWPCYPEAEADDITCNEVP